MTIPAHLTFKITPSVKATTYVAISATLYGCLGYFGISLSHQPMTMSSMLFWRFAIASVWLLLVKCKDLPHLAKQARNHLLLINTFFLGAIFYASASLLYFLASRLTGTGIAMVIFFTYPLLVVLLCIILQKYRPGIYTFLALIFIVVGLVLLEGGHQFDLNKMGMLLSLISAFCYALYIYSSKRVTHMNSSYLLTVMVCLGATVFFLIATLLTHSFSFPANLKNWLYAIALGVFATALPIQLLLAGLKNMHPSKAAILSVLEPLMTLLIAVVILHEPILLIQAIGAAIILLSAIFVQFDKSS